MNIVRRNSRKTKRYSQVRVLNPDGSIREVVSINKLTNRKPQLRVLTGREGKEYHQFRKEVLRRDNYKCVLCDDIHRMEVHHIIRYADNEEERLNVDNGVTLCYQCHQKYHNYDMRQFPERITKILTDYIALKNNINNIQAIDKFAEMESRADTYIPARQSSR